VIIDQAYGAPKVTKDGVTVAKNIEFKDRYENAGAQLIRQVASKTNDTAGDGTTTATILARFILAQGCKSVEAGLNPMDVRRGINTAVERVIENLKKRSIPVTSKDQIRQVATISANNDEKLGALIADAMDKVGKDGAITTQDGRTLYDELEIVEGMKLDRGYISPFFVTDAKTQKCELENPFILVLDKKISNLTGLVKALEFTAPQNRPLLIIAEDVDGDALATLVVNRLRAGLKVCAVKAPGFGDNRKNQLHDIATMVGAQVISEEVGLKFDDTTNFEQVRAAVLVSLVAHGC
jgi:chaperonin GroEL